MRWDVELRNAGNSHEAFSGVLVLDGVAGRAGRRAIDNGVLLPGESRRFPVSVDLRDAPDVVRATARIDRDGAQRVSDAASRTVVLPWWILLVLVVAAVSIGWRLHARRRSDRAWGLEAGASGP